MKHKWMKSLLTVMLVSSLTLAAQEPTDPGQQFQLGEKYLAGNDAAQNFEEAGHWFTKAAQQGHVRAQIYVAWMLDSGRGLPRDDAGAVEWYRKAAEQGHPEGQYRLGLAYSNGDGVRMDETKAIEWFRLAAEQGHAGAQHALAAAYGQGSGVPRDYGDARTWYLRAAEQGHAGAQGELAILYELGRGVEKDYTQARKWYLRAAEQGDVMARFFAAHFLGSMYKEGSGVPPDAITADMWYRISGQFTGEQGGLENGMTKEEIAEAKRLAAEWLQQHPAPDANEPLDPSDELALGRRHLPVERGYFENGEAARGYRRVAETGDTQAQYNLGFLYLYHINNSPNPDNTQAYVWYSLSAEAGHPKAGEMRDLAAQDMSPEQIAEGNRLVRDWQETHGLVGTPAPEMDEFSMPAEEPEALKRVREYRAKPEDYAVAAKWYGRKARQGDPEAQYQLGLLYGNGNGVMRDEDRMVELHREAAEQGYAPAQNSLGRMYSRGWGVLPKDDAEAVKWYSLAYKQGDMDAQMSLGIMYVDGRGVPRDVVKGLTMMRKTIERVEETVGREAAGAAAMMYWGAQSRVLHNAGEVLDSVREQAAGGHEEAQALLAMMYAEGAGVPEDKMESSLWQMLSATGGHPAGTQAVKEMARHLSPEQFADIERRAKEWQAAHPGVGRPIEELLRDIPRPTVSGWMTTNEVAARGTITSIVSCAEAYARTHKDDGFPDTLASLSPRTYACLGKEESSGEGSGYRFDFRGVNRVGTANKGFVLVAVPVEYGKTGKRSFYSDESGIIRFTDEDRAATADDAILE